MRIMQPPEYCCQKGELFLGGWGGGRKREGGGGGRRILFPIWQ